VRVRANRGHPCVEFEGAIAFRHAALGKVGVGFGAVKPAGKVIPAHGAGVGGHRISIGAHELVHGQPRGLAAKVPEGLVHRAQIPVMQRGAIQPLKLA